MLSCTILKFSGCSKYIFLNTLYDRSGVSSKYVRCVQYISIRVSIGCGVPSSKVMVTVLHDKFEITMWRNKDKRYATVDAPSSITIDDFILENLPNDLDIVQHKIYKKSKQDEAV